ncbi:MAG: ATP-binding cassette domain-containing protein [Kiritimatiellae bacterium]|nr:ATP-binding cassette domain-containing protein [Kiritimatiellia bacterium]
MIKIEHVTKTFRDFWCRPKVTAVKNLTFNVPAGEVFGLLGPNGSGKSTIIKMILGLLYPSRGSLTVMGKTPRDVHVKEDMGYLPEESYLYPYLTADETLQFYGNLFSLEKKIRKERIGQLLEMMGLTHARDRRIGEFPKGMVRRIGLAQALINDPDLLILDEPTSGLDPLGCRQVKDLIRTLAQRGKTILLCSHLLADVEDVCDRIAILYHGHIQAIGPIKNLLEEKNQHRLTLSNIQPNTMKSILEAVRGIIGQNLKVDHPQKDLEQLFMEVVEKAEGQTHLSSGVSASKRVAPYLDPGSSESI